MVEPIQYKGFKITPFQRLFGTNDWTAEITAGDGTDLFVPSTDEEARGETGWVKRFVISARQYSPDSAIQEAKRVIDAGRLRLTEPK
jgi:hypothetical protein